jgi:hypothetical protein
MLRCSKLHELSLSPAKLAWPWVAFSPERMAFAVPSSPRTLAIHRYGSLRDEARVELPEVLPVPSAEPGHSGTTSRQAGLHAIALHPDARTAVAFGWHRDLPAACVARAGVAPEVVDLGPALGDMGPMAATFTRDGESLWLSAESSTGAAIVRLRFRDFALESKVAFPPAPPPASHELFLHPVDDAALLTMACGQDGTFVRVARAVDGRLELVAGEGDGGLDPCGPAEATDDGARVCLVTLDRVELRRWPDLKRESAFDLPDGLSANYNGVRIGGRFIVSAAMEDEEDEPCALVLGDTLELVDNAPAPPGMWAGRLGPDRLVTVDPGRSGPAAAFVYAIEV